MLVTLGVFVNLWIKNWKGRKSFITLLFDSIKDLLIYTMQEFKGDAVQLMNALLGLCLAVFFITSLAMFFWKHLYDKPTADVLVACLSSIIVLIVSMPICAKYTRHR